MHVRVGLQRKLSTEELMLLNCGVGEVFEVIDISPSNLDSSLCFFQPSVSYDAKSINSLVLSFLYSPTLTCIHDHWKNHSLD